MCLAGLQTGFQHRVDEFRRSAEIGHALGGSIVEQHIAVGIEGRTVIEQKCSAGGDTGSQPVPHHPSAGGEIEEAITVANIRMQAVFFQVLQQHTARAMHNAFRNARRAGRKQDTKRMIEGEPRELDFFGLERFQSRIKRNALFSAVSNGFRFAEIGDDDGTFQARQLCRHLSNLVGNVNALAIIPVAIAGEEKLWFDLAETVEYALHAKIRRA